MRLAHYSKFDAFTLIELLIVIAIVALLAAILFPVFGLARENARRSTCLSNEKQIGLGLIQYSQDYDGTYVSAWYGPVSQPTGHNGYDGSDPTQNLYKWMDCIYPYVKNQDVFDCPDDPNLKTDYYVYYKYLPAQSSSNYGSYGLNSAYYTPGDPYIPPESVYNGSADTYSVYDSEVAVPANTVWMMDINNSALNFGWTTPSTQPGGANVTSPAITPGEPRTFSTTVERHLDTTAVLYCDGHAKALKFEAVCAVTNHIYTQFIIEPH